MRKSWWIVNAALFALILAVGGSLFEHLVIDPAWPANIAIIQPGQGGVNRKLFWIPVHTALTVLLAGALWATWRRPDARRWVLVSIACYAAMRIWSAAYFIPLALRFEALGTMTPALTDQARTWVVLSVIRSLLLVAATAALAVTSHTLACRDRN